MSSMKRRGFATVAALLIAGCAGSPSPSIQAPICPPCAAETPLAPPRPVLSFAPIDLAAALGDLDPEPALAAFRRQCAAWERADPAVLLNPRAAYAGRVQDWGPACAALPPSSDATRARGFFLAAFDAFALNADPVDPPNRLTAYYEPVFDAARAPSSSQWAPVPAPPAWLTRIQLGDFDPTLAGRAFYGKVEAGRLVPAPPRAQIPDEPARALGFLHPADLYVLQVQGSGQLRFADNDAIRAGFAGHNQWPFRSVTRALVENGALAAANANAAGLRAHFDAIGPEAARAALALNPRMVFFTAEPIDARAPGPKGAAGLPLTPLGSLAVDRAFHAFGAPFLIKSAAFSGLVIAQDEGGAILGPLRGDLYYGSGAAAGRAAERITTPVDWVVLLPKGLDPRVAATAP